MEVRDGAELCFPQLNTSCTKPKLSPPTVTTLHFLLSSVSLLTVALNLLVIISVSHFRQLHKPTNLLLLSLSVSDLIVGLVFLPGEILRLTDCWFLGDLMCSLYIFVSSLTVFTSIGEMMLISADRYVAVCDPLRYATRVTVTRVKLCILLCWLCSGFYSSLMVRNNTLQTDKYSSCDGECVIMLDSVAGVIDLVVTFILPVSVIIILYLRVFVVAVSQARAVRSHVNAVKLQPSVKLKTKKSELKAARTLGVVVVVFLICLSPFYCCTLAGDNSFTTTIFVYWLICFNSCLNPVIYALFYPWFRKAVKLIVTLQILQPDSCEANMQ